jgi:two-component system alkaline phosphatase synthesis response regulator PhoP
MSPKRILIIDDEDDIREVAALALDCAGDFEVTTASGGLTGLKTAHDFRPDLILLDVMMPELDGPSVYRLLAADEVTRSIPVIFLTAKVQAADRGSLRSLGALGIIAKPFDPLRLAEEIAALAGWTAE